MREIVIQKLKGHTTFGTWFRCSFFKWDHASKRLVLHSKKRQNVVRFFILLNGSYVLLQWGSIFWKKMETVEKTQSFFFATLYSILIALWSAWTPDPAIMDLLNCITSRNIVDDSPNRKFLKLLKIFYHLVYATCVFLPIGIFLLVLVSPCQPPLLGSMILTLDQCSGSLIHLPLLQLIHRICLGTMDGLLIMQLLVGGLFYDVDGLLTGISYLVMECNRALAFQFGNFLKYRELQVLEKLLNDSVRKRIFPIVAFSLPGLQVACCFSVIHLHDKVPFTSLPLYLGVYLDVLIFNMIVFVGAARIHILAKEWVFQFTKNAKITKGKREKRKIIGSLRPLRAEFGSNFADALTPLVIQHFCLTQTASLLVLMARSKQVNWEEIL